MGLMKATKVVSMKTITKETVTGLQLAPSLQQVYSEKIANTSEVTILLLIEVAITLCLTLAFSLVDLVSPRK